MVPLHNDKPILGPLEDRFGIDPFAATLAKGILSLGSPDGTVVALNGPWGSGKSSIVNLVLHHLSTSVKADELSILQFNCWWFRGEEALALAFFQELYSGLAPSLGNKFRKALPKLGARLLKAGKVVGSAIDLAGGGGAASLAAGAMDWASEFIKQDGSVERLYRQVLEALTNQNKRFLIVIDDIDRLAPDEALLIFRLVKSVGKLPNVIYLLVFDRSLAEKIVAQHYPSEGPQYLEKIIQVSFDIPIPRREDLRAQLLERIGEICGVISESESVRFMNVFYDVVAPEINSPRDVVRLANGLSVSWPAIGAEVDQADLLGVETLRILQPTVFNAVRANKERLTGASKSGSSYSKDQKSEYDKTLLSSLNEKNVERLRQALKRLFPRLESVWGNLYYSDDSLTEWQRQRRVCSSSHFDSYLRLSIPDSVLKREEIDTLIEKAADRGFIEAALREAVATILPNGTTKAALILEELNLHSTAIPDAAVEPLLTALFAVADELNTSRDQAKAFSIGDNQLRLHWLLRRLTLERFAIDRRSALIIAASQTASIGWLTDLASSAHALHVPREGKQPYTEQQWITTKLDAEKLCRNALASIRTASKGDTLLKHPKLAFLLFQWREFADDSGRQVKRWTKVEIERDASVVAFAGAFTSHGWSHSVSDTVAKRTTIANVNGLDLVMDAKKFGKRIDALLAKPDLSEEWRSTLSEFAIAWGQEKQRGKKGA